MRTFIWDLAQAIGAGVVLGCLLAVLIAIVGCRQAEHDVVVSVALPGHTEAPVNSPTTAAEADKQLDKKNKEIAELERQLGQANLDKGQLTKERDRLAEEEEIKRIRRFTLWASWLAGFGFFASVIAWFLLTSYAPWIGKLCIGGAAASIGTLALARVVAWLAPYLFVIGCVLTGIGVLVLIFYLWKGKKLTQGVVKLYEEAKPIVDKALGKEARLELQAKHVAQHSPWIAHIQRKIGINQ